MAGFSESMRALVVTASSPDGQIKARLDGDENLTVGFRPRTYSRYTDRELADQLAGLLTRVWAEYHQGWLRALGEAHGVVYRTKPVDWRAEHRAFDEAVAKLVTLGKSPRGLVELKARGFTEWRVRLADGAVAGCDEAGFTGEVLAAYRLLLRDDRRKTALLKHEHFGLLLPPSWRAEFPR